MDIKPQPNYPFKFHLADALEFPLDGYDAYHASPPCQAYVDFNSGRPSKHPRLIEPTRERLIATGGPFIIENVHKAPLRGTLMLCGTMFGLPLIRHRYFEFNWEMPILTNTCYHWGSVAMGDYAAVYARGGHGPRHGKGIREPSPRACKVTPEEAMGIDWMRPKELTQAIPPAYTEYIGKILITLMR